VIVPANRKWYRDLAIADALVSTLRSHRRTWRARLEELNEQRLKELADLRARDVASGVAGRR